MMVAVRRMHQCRCCSCYFMLNLGLHLVVAIYGFGFSMCLQFFDVVSIVYKLLMPLSPLNAYLIIASRVDLDVLA